MIRWPSHCLLVAVRHGDREIIPNGETVLYAGDYLVILTNEDKTVPVSERIRHLTSR
jgi:Trk K+ transport system NAD-binding subunit